MLCFLQAIINEDTQGNVRQLQAEVKKLKEQLAQALTSQEFGRDGATGGAELQMSEFITDMLDLKKKYFLVFSNKCKMFFLTRPIYRNSI